MADDPKFPRGKFSADDEGQLNALVTVKDKTIIIHFGKQVVWLGLSAADAREFVRVLTQRADQIDPPKVGHG